MKEYHIHVNGLYVGSRFRIFLTSLGLIEKPFLLQLVGTNYTPPVHFSTKTKSKSEFDDIFDSLSKVVPAQSDFFGYVEAEIVRKRLVSSGVAGAGSMKIPTIDIRPSNRWRESEIHLSSITNSPTLINAEHSGFYCSRIRKEDDRIWDVYTAQGESKVINELWNNINEINVIHDYCCKITIEELVSVAHSKGFNWAPPQVFNVRNL